MPRVQLLAAFALLASTSAFAQVQSRPTDPPVANASAESWYQLREPMVLGGDVYYHAGAAVFFDGNVMVRTGHYNGVPLYADATLEPYSVVYVPIGRGLMQPYERRRQGALAGTVGSRLPAFAVQLLGDPAPAMTATAPTRLPFSAGAIVSYTPETITFTPQLPVFAAVPAVTPAPVTAVAAEVPSLPFVPQVILSPTLADGNDGVWLRFQDARWVSSGRATPRGVDLVQVGSYGAFPVFRRPGGDDQIFIPTREGLVAPYRRKG